MAITLYVSERCPYRELVADKLDVPSETKRLERLHSKRDRVYCRLPDSDRSRPSLTTTTESR